MRRLLYIMIEDLTLVFFALLAYLTIRRRGVFYRLAALAVVFFLIANPAIRKKSSAPAPVLAVCLDTSSSMAVKNGKSSRLEAAKGALRRELPDLKKKFKLVFYTFDSEPRLLGESAFFNSRASGGASLISRSASEITASLPEGGSMLLLSDGRDTTSESCYFSKPVHCAGFGQLLEDDMSLKILEYPEKVFQGSVSKARVRVECPPGRGPARIRIGRPGEKGGEKPVVFSEGETVKDIDVEFIPGEAGDNIRYNVELLPSDTNPGNNSDFFRVSVFKSLMKVLFISGRPGWEYSNLRALIKSDKRIDLTSFVILRNPSDYVPFPDNKLSLIPFPVREIFLNDITNYDLVILLNFDYTKFISPDYLSLLLRHIRSGGALMLIGGEDLFSNGNYFKSPLGEILPVTECPGGSFSEEKFFLRASPSHPVTSLISGISAAGDVPLKGMSPASSLAPDAQSVLTTSGGDPVAAVRNEGKGRVMTLLTNSLWRLFFAGPETSYFYQEFFKNSFAWLTRSPLLDEISLSGRKNYKIGEDLLLRIQLRNALHSGVTVRHVAPGGQSYLPPVMVSPGVFVVKKIIEEPGPHSVRISVSGERGVRAEKVFSFTVTEKSIEEENTSAKHSHLREISRLSLGKYLGSDLFRAADIPAPVDDSGFYHPAMKNYYLIFTALFFVGLWFKDNTR